MREKKLRDRRVGLLVLGIAAFLSLIGAADPLNPLVVRTERAQATVPVECETGLSLAPSLRVDLRDIPLPAPEPSSAAAPPSGELRGSLEDVQTALAGNNRAAFDDALARARSLTEAHPQGGERRAAGELIRLYEGTRRLWDAQYQSPFFSEESTEYAIASAHPGYAEAMRRNTITDATGRRFYPAAESRTFLTGITADRLKALGVRSPARAPRSERREIAAEDESRPLPAIRPRSTSARSTRTTSGTPRRPRTTSAAKSPATRSTRKPAAVKSASSSPNPSAPPTRTAAPKPAAPPVAESTTPATASSPAAGEPSSPAADVPPAIDEPTDIAVTETAPGTGTIPIPETGLTTPATSTVPAPADTTPLRQRSVLLPAILILIGLAVLIVLFRASK